MIEVTVGVVIAAAVAAFLIGFTKAGTGGGLGPVITAVMVLVLPVEVALGIQLPMLIAGDVFSVGAYWGQWERRHVVRLGAGAVIGVLAGTFVLTSVDAATIQRLIAVLALSFVAFRLVQPRVASWEALRAGPVLGLVAGAAGAASSTVAHFGAPPVAIYLLSAKVSPSVYTATHILLFAAINLLKVPAYLAAGMFNLDLQLRLAPALVMLPVGVAVGRLLVSRIAPRTFDRVILTILTATGLYLLFR